MVVWSLTRFLFPCFVEIEFVPFAYGFVEMAYRFRTIKLFRGLVYWRFEGIVRGDFILRRLSWLTESIWITNEALTYSRVKNGVILNLFPYKYHNATSFGASYMFICLLVVSTHYYFVLLDCFKYNCDITCNGSSWYLNRYGFALVLCV